jgi:hypothetical protein
VEIRDSTDGPSDASRGLAISWIRPAKEPSIGNIVANCGFVNTEDARELKMEWGPKLNDHHLFENLEDARLFTQLSEKRVSEHSPFFIFGLWSKSFDTHS